jgi:hypothetical protein
MKRFLTSFAFTAFVGWLTFVLTILFTAPNSWQNYILFFSTLVLASTFTLALFLHFISSSLGRSFDSRLTLRASLRRGFLISLCLCTLLLLKLLNLLSPFNIGLLVSAVILLEVYLSQ